MAEEKKPLTRGVVIEFDFTAIDGSQLLFETAQKILAAKGVDLTIKLEAMHLSGGNYQGGLAELFRALDKKCDAAATARDLHDAFGKALTAKAVAAVTPGLKAFITALVERDVKVVIATRSDLEVLRPAFEGFAPEKGGLYSEPSVTYGNGKWDAWRRACSQNGLVDVLTVGVTGSGKGVKSALVAGMSAIAILHDHVAYQDSGGADVVVDSVDATLAAASFRRLHM